jgi:hypothetical protein
MPHSTELIPKSVRAGLVPRLLSISIICASEWVMTLNSFSKPFERVLWRVCFDFDHLCVRMGHGSELILKAALADLALCLLSVSFACASAAVSAPSAGPSPNWTVLCIRGEWCPLSLSFPFAKPPELPLCTAIPN